VDFVDVPEEVGYEGTYVAVGVTTSTSTEVEVWPFLPVINVVLLVV
jgi:hypothetical protein